jgi:GTPase SAR1 family protein
MDAKVIFVGNCGVGKTNLISKICLNSFNPKSESTIAFDSMKLPIGG